MKRIRFFYVLLALVALLLLVACSSEVQAPPAEETPAEQTPAGEEPTDEPAAEEEPTEEPAAEEEPTEEPAAEEEPTEEPATEEQATPGTEEAGGTDVLAQIREKGVLVVGTSADYPPYESVDAEGNFVGFDMDIIREVGNRLGVEVEIQDMAFDALIASLQEGKIDAIIAAMQATPERDEQVDFTRHYNWPKDAFLVAGDSDVTISAPEDIAELNVGVQTGTAQERWVLENLVETGQMTEDRLFRYERTDQAALDLGAGRIDVLIIIADVARDLAEQQGLTVALESEETIAAGQAIAIPDGATTLKAELDEILTEMEEEGFISDLKAQYSIP